MMTRIVQRTFQHLRRDWASRLPSYSHSSIQEIFSVVCCGMLLGEKLILKR